MPEGIGTSGDQTHRETDEQSVHDALADLFMTGVVDTTFASVEMASPDPAPLPDELMGGFPEPRGSGPADTTNISQARRLAELRAGNASARSAPKPVSQPATNPATRPARTTERRIEQGVELVLTGHLPVRGSVWARQYADALAKTNGGPVALLRAAQGTLVAERIEPADYDLDHVISARTSDDIIRDTTSVLTLASDLDALDVTDAPEIRRITVLTSANDAAIVHAYQLLKAIAFKQSQRGTDDDTCTLGVGVVGEPRDKARSAHARIARASLSFLGREIEHRPGCERCSPVQSSARVEFNAPAESVIMVASRRTKLHAEPASTSPDPKPQPHHTEHQHRREALTRESTPAMTPDPVRSPRPRTALGMPGLPEKLTPVGFKCPDAPEVTLGVDGDGMLHAVIAGRDISALLRARRWATKNASILALADTRLKAWSTTGDLVGHAVYGEGVTAGSLIVSGKDGHAIRELRPVVWADDHF